MGGRAIQCVRTHLVFVNLHLLAFGQLLLALVEGFDLERLGPIIVGST